MKDKVYLNIFDNDENPRVIFTPSDGWWINYFGALELLHLGRQSLGGAIKMSSGEPATNDGVTLLTITQFLELYNLDLLHLVDFKEVNQLFDRRQLTRCEELFVRLIRLLGSEAPHKVLLRSFN